MIDNKDNFDYEKPLLQSLLFNDITAILIGGTIGFYIAYKLLS